MSAFDSEIDDSSVSDMDIMKQKEFNWLKEMEAEEELGKDEGKRPEGADAGNGG